MIDFGESVHFPKGLRRITNTDEYQKAISVVDQVDVGVGEAVFDHVWDEIVRADYEPKGDVK